MCALNPCRSGGDGYVLFRGKCHRLNKPGPCSYSELSYVVAANETTLQLDCIQQSSPPLLPGLSDRFAEDDDDTTTNTSSSTTEQPATAADPLLPNLCPVGNRRWITHTCPAAAAAVVSLSDTTIIMEK